MQTKKTKQAKHITNHVKQFKFETQQNDTHQIKPKRPNQTE